MEFQKKRKIEVVATGNEYSSVRIWEDLDINILVMIFLSFWPFPVDIYNSSNLSCMGIDLL